MAAVRTHDSVLAFTSGNSIAVSDLRNPDAFHTVNLPASTEGKPVKADEEDGAGCGGAGEGSGGGINRALASGFSRPGRYFAVCDDLKKLHVYCTESRPWTLLSSRSLARRATSLTFTLDEATVLVADKSGDVYSFPTLTATNGQAQEKNGSQVKDEGNVNEEGRVKEEDQVKDEDKVKDEGKIKGGGEVKTEGQLLLGHLSMVLDVCLAEDDRYVVTCDRDEKIRISHHPNGYNIHAFCLGHSQFVSCLLYVTEFRLLISGSGDGSLAVWNMQGKQLCRARLPEKAKPPSVVPQQPPPPQQQQPPPPPPPQPEEPRDKQREEEEEEEEEERKGVEEEGGEGERRRGRAVRQLVYSERHRLVFVACYSHAEVEVYQLTAGAAGGGGQCPPTPTPTPTLTHLQTLPVPAAPWNVAWDDSNATLWVLSPVEGATLSAFQLRRRRRKEEEEGGEEVQQLCRVDNTDTNTSSGVLESMQTVNSKWTFFKESLSVADELAGLWKTMGQDNVQQYQHRKQLRLQTQHQQQQQQQHHQKGARQEGRKRPRGGRSGAADLPEKVGKE